MTEQPNPNELLLITREELERCCSQMSAAGYKVSANYVEASVLSRSRPAPSPAPIRSMREDEDGYISWQQMNERALEEHDAAIAAKVRKDVLDEAITTIDHQIGAMEDCVVEMQNLRTVNHTMNKIESFRAVIEILESLRTEGGERK